MSPSANCNLCSNTAQYYCTTCKKKLCKDHIVLVNTVFYCDCCEIECFGENCHSCGNRATFKGYKETKICVYCKSPDVIDGTLYHRQMPQKIYESFEQLLNKMPKLRVLTDQYDGLVKVVYSARKSKIKIFPEIEEELSMLRCKIANFIDGVERFDSDLFNELVEKLQQVKFFRFINFADLTKAEEIMVMIARAHQHLDKNMNDNITRIQEEIKNINLKIDYLKFQSNIIEKIHLLLPEKKESLVAVIPRLWISKNKRILQKNMLLFTNKNIYIVREKGLFSVKLKLKEDISLSSIAKIGYKDTFLTGKSFVFNTNTDSYEIWGRKDTIDQFEMYFEILSNYQEYNIENTAIIEGLLDKNLNLQNLKKKIDTHTEYLRAHLLNKQEIKKEIRVRDRNEAIKRELEERRLMNKRRMINILQARKNGFQNTKVSDDILRRILLEQNRIDQQLHELSNTDDELFNLS